MTEAAFAAHVISGPDFILGSSVHAADFDGDGDLDVLATAELGDSVAWYENTDGQGTFGDGSVIATLLKDVYSAYPGDIDGDGDLDVVSVGWTNGSNLSWYENRDAQGRFGRLHSIGAKPFLNNNRESYSVYVADVDGDGDADVLSAWNSFNVGDNVIEWYENTDGQGTFGDPRVITTEVLAFNYSHPGNVYAGDVDADGDLDVLSAADNRIAWYENIDGKGTFADERVITSNARSAASVYPADVDGDRDLDVLAASYGDDTIAWYENLNGKGTFGDQQVITTAADGATSVYAGDVDGDGDLDVLSASEFYNDNRIAWYENTNVRGSFGNQEIIARSAAAADSVSAADLDGDGDLDVLSVGLFKVAWYENLLGPPTRTIGDANGDGSFNSSDLIVVFQSGEYEDGVPQNSTFEEGDWNDDHEFDTSDLVLAFQAGTYMNAAQRISDPIAAVDWLFADGTNSRKPKAFRA